MIKKIKYLLLIVACIGCGDVFAQTDTVPKIQNPQRVMTLLKTNPLPILWGPIPLTAEYRFIVEEVIATNQSLQVGFSFLGKSPLLALVEDSSFNGGAPVIKIKVKGFRFQAGWRYYLTNLTEMFGFSSGTVYAPEGFYIMPHFSYSSARFTPRIVNPIHLRISHLNANMLLGTQLFLGDNIAMDIFAGLGYKKNKWVEYYSPTRQRVIIPTDLGGFYNGPVKLTLGFNFGIAF